MLGFISFLLVEAKEDELAAKYPNVPVKEYAAKDPSPTKKFLPWLVKSHLKGEFGDLGPNHPDIEPTLQNFDRYKRQHGIVDHQQHTFKDVADKIRPLVGTPATEQERKQKENVEGIEKIHEEPGGIKAFHVKTKEASQNLYGGGDERGGEKGGFRGTTWCTSARSENCLFETQYGKMYTIHDPNDDNAPYAVHPQDGHVTDRFNKPGSEIPIKEFEEKNPHLKSAIHKIHEHYANNFIPKLENRIKYKLNHSPNSITENEILDGVNSRDLYASEKEKLINHPSATKDILMKMANSDNPSVQRTIFHSQKIDDDVLKEALKNQNLSKDSFNQISKHASKPFFEELMNDPNHWKGAVYNKNFNKSHFDKIINSTNDPQILKNLLDEFPEHLKPEDASRLLEHENQEIKQRVSAHENLPESDISKIVNYKQKLHPQYLGFPLPDEHQKYTTRMVENVLKYAKNLNSNHLESVLRQPELGYDAIKLAINHPQITKKHLTDFLERNPKDDFNMNPDVKKRLKELNAIKEEFSGTPTVSASSGQVAGLGIENPNIPNQKEPGVSKKRKSPLMSFGMFQRIKPRVSK